MNKKVSLGVTLALIFLSIAMTVSITVVIAMRHFGTMQMDLQQRVTMFDYVNDIDKAAHRPSSRPSSLTKSAAQWNSTSTFPS